MGAIEQTNEMLARLMEEIADMRNELRDVIDQVNEKPMSMSEACAFVGISENTMRKLAESGKVEGRKFGREWRFKKKDLLNYKK